MFPCNRGCIPEAGREVMGAIWCWEHAVWVYQFALAVAPVDSGPYRFASQGLQRIEQVAQLVGWSRRFRPKRPRL